MFQAPRILWRGWQEKSDQELTTHLLKKEKNRPIIQPLARWDRAKRESALLSPNLSYVRRVFFKVWWHDATLFVYLIFSSMVLRRAAL
jgi:hypothetical protein